MKKVLVISKREFDKVMRDNKITAENIENRSKVAFISINDTFGTTETPFFKEDKENLRILFFDDVTEDTKLNWGTAKAFNKEQGKIVLEFLNKIKDRDTLIVHCHAGISRSGAVGQFAADYFGLDYKEFRNLNPHIHPNSTVTRILRELAREQED